MHIAFHIGANCTDEDRLLKSILRNAPALLQQDIVVPGPGKYRGLLRETIQGLAGAPASSEAREILLDAIIEQEDAARVVLTNDNFITIPKRIFDHGVFYSQTETKLRGLRKLFPEDELSLYFSIRHPVSFLQDVARLAEANSLRHYLGLMSPFEMRWSDVIKRIKRGAPDAPLYVWCNEDAPLIWEDLIRLQSGLSEDVPVEGATDTLARILGPEGIAAIKTTPMPTDRVARHSFIGDLIERYGQPEMIEEEIDHPELTPELIATMSDVYEEDLETIDALDGVKLILPFA